MTTYSIKQKLKDGSLYLQMKNKKELWEELLFSKQALRKAWTSKTSLNKQARRRKYACVVYSVPDEMTALRLSSLFVYWVVEDPSRIHYDGKTISFYVGGLKNIKGSILKIIDFPGKLEAEVKNGWWFFADDVKA